MHLNVVGKSHSTELRECLEPFIYDWTGLENVSLPLSLIESGQYFSPARHGGSISAEHGLGLSKAKYIYHSKSRETVQWMKRLKQLFDPNVSPPTPRVQCIYLL